MRITFFRRKNCIRLTLLGWVTLLVFLIVIIRLSLSFIYPYLAINKPIKSKTLIIEGWVPTYAIKEAVKLYIDDHYERLIVTGIPIVNYEFIAPYRNTAEATILALRHYGISDTIYIANIPTNIFVDRTYNTALATKLLFEENEWPNDFNIYSLGVHSRRTKLMFRKAFGSDYNIGIIAPRDRTFLPDVWWKSSKGFRNVSNEFVATVFVSLFFQPNKEESVDRIRLGRYYDSIYYLREDKYIEFTDSTTTRLNKEELKNFTRFKYYEPDISYKVKCDFEVDTSGNVFKMKTSTDRLPPYRVYGYLSFEINDTTHKLAAYQNIKYKDHPEYGNYLFVPFKDLTNGITTYEAGRYIDIEIPKSNQVILDFNTAYNPYCAYYSRWSCPLVPFENHLHTSIPVGEKKYK